MTVGQLITRFRSLATHKWQGDQMEILLQVPGASDKVPITDVCLSVDETGTCILLLRVT